MPETIAAQEVRPEEAVYTIPEDPERSIYRFIIVAAKRARQLQSGAKPKVPVAARKLTRVAVEETRRGFIAFIDPVNAPPVAEEEEPVADQ
jgi:DNA-directed RNA polymerase subunit omega